MILEVAKEIVDGTWSACAAHRDGMKTIGIVVTLLLTLEAEQKPLTHVGP